MIWMKRRKIKTYHFFTLSIAFIALLSSSRARLLVSNRTLRDILSKNNQSSQQNTCRKWHQLGNGCKISVIHSHDDKYWPLKKVHHVVNSIVIEWNQCAQIQKRKNRARAKWYVKWCSKTTQKIKVSALRSVNSSNMFFI